MPIALSANIALFYCPYTLVMRCGRVSEIKPLWWFEFMSRELHHVTRSHDMARSNHWCQWLVLFRTTYRTVSFCNWDVALRNLPESIWVEVEAHSLDAFSIWTANFSFKVDWYIYYWHKLVLELQTTQSAVRYLYHSGTQCTSLMCIHIREWRGRSIGYRKVLFQFSIIFHSSIFEYGFLYKRKIILRRLSSLTS